MKNINTILLITFLLLFSGCASMMLNIPSDVEENARNNGAPVYIGPIKIGPANSAGGKEVGFIWKSIGNKDIKYLTIRTNLYNRVDDRVSCRIGFSGSLRFTGPISPGTYRQGRPQSLCYDSTAIRGEVRSIIVVYMDDSTETIEREKLIEMGALHEDA